MNALTATRPATATGLTASVIIAAYSNERWEYLRAAVASVAAIIAGLGMAVAGFAAGGASAALGRGARAARTPRTAAERAR